jgi:A/G-specific adenine glycosylase
MGESCARLRARGRHLPRQLSVDARHDVPQRSWPDPRESALVPCRRGAGSDQPGWLSAGVQSHIAHASLAGSLAGSSGDGAVTEASARSAVAGVDKRWLRRCALRWFDEHGRLFPWRGRSDPYRVLIAETMLQRTRADLVVPTYQEFISRYPDPRSLASAEPAAVIRLLRPLGFAHRNARVPCLGRELVERHGGHVPKRKEDLLALSGVGEYIANAVLAVGFGERRALLDPNVIRVLARATGIASARSRARSDPALWEATEALLPRLRSTNFSLALIDIGAGICRPRRPRCRECPFHSRCRALAAGAVRPADTP